MAWWDELSGPTRDAGAALIDLFTEMGLGTLAPRIIQYLQQGYGGDTITLLLQGTPEYKQRFKANELREKAGLPVLNPGEYLQTERAYRAAIQAAGLPAGFYDSHDDFTDFLVKDISPSEIAERATRAREAIDTIDPVQRAALSRVGIDTGALAAYYLDSRRALPELNKRFDTALLDAERKRAGFDYNAAEANRLFQLGITTEQAREGYNLIANIQPNVQRLGEISGDVLTVDELGSEVFGGNADVTRRRGRLASQERGRFSGSSGTGTGTLTRNRQFN